MVTASRKKNIDYLSTAYRSNVRMRNPRRRKRFDKTVYSNITAFFATRSIQRHSFSRSPLRRLLQSPKPHHAARHRPCEWRQERSASALQPPTTTANRVLLPAAAATAAPSSTRRRRDDPAPVHGAGGGGRRGGGASLQDAAAEAGHARARHPQARAWPRHGAHRRLHRPHRARLQRPQHGQDPRPRLGRARRRRGWGAHPHRSGPPRAPPPRGLAHGYARPDSQTC
jgi:hypothetical protein